MEELDSFFEHYHYEVDKAQEAMRIDKFLNNRLPNTSRNRIQNAIKTGNIQVNHQAVKPNYKVRPFDEISVLLPDPPREKELQGENIPLDVVYEDEALMVVNKAAGMVVHPGFNNYSGTLVNALKYHFDQLPTGKNGHDRPGLVHRIDKDTSGLLVIAKDEFSMSHLAKQFFDHSVKRLYLALVWGNLNPPKGTITGHIGRSVKDRKVMQVYEDESQGKHAVTHYEVIENFGLTNLIQCQLETGRTHQIRIHLKHKGHPLFADEVYGGSKILAGQSYSKFKQFVENCFKIMPRQALHAYSLGFVHPYSKKELYFEAPLPDDFEQVLQKWRKYIPSSSS